GTSCLSSFGAIAESPLGWRNERAKNNQKSVRVYSVLRSDRLGRLRKVQHLEEFLQRLELVLCGVNDGAPLLRGGLRPVLVLQADPAIGPDFDDDRVHGCDVKLHQAASCHNFGFWWRGAMGVCHPTDHRCHHKSTFNARATQPVVENHFSTGVRHPSDTELWCQKSDA